jgi:hypothetical protein
MAPGHTQARQLRDQAVSTRDRAAQGMKDARAHLAAGRYEEASRVAGDVLSLVPGHEDARVLMQDAAERSRGEGAETARARMNQAKNDARAVDAPSLAAVAYRGALAAERTAEQLYGRRQMPEATAKFYEASGLFQSAKLAAQSEAAARVERAAAARTAPAAEPAAPDKAAATPPQAQPTEPPAPPPAPPANPAPQLPTGRAGIGGAGSPLPGTGTPIVTPPAPPRVEPSAESLITDLLARYDSALEARSLAALKRIWPGLTGSQEAAINDEFEHARRITVEIVAPRIDISGETATAVFTRRYEIATTDGQQHTRVSLTTMRLRRGSGGWGIEQVRFEPVR